MFIVQDNSDGRLLHLQQQIDELRSEARIMRAEIDRLKSAAPNASSAEADASTDRKAYMRAYMAKRRSEARTMAEKKAQG